MQVVPICIVACLLVVSLSGTEVYKQGECHRLNRVKYMTINNKRARCQCKVDNNGNKVWMCKPLIGCNIYSKYYKVGTKRDGCKCMKNAKGYYWFCTQCLYGPPPRYYNINAIWTDETSQKKCTCAKLSFGTLKVICQNAGCFKTMSRYIRKTALGTCTCTKGDGGLGRWECHKSN